MPRLLLLIPLVLATTDVLCRRARAHATPVDRFHLADGFQVELLYSVPKAQQGSWVNMTVDPKNRLIVSDQEGSLYRVTPGKDAETTTVEKLPVEIGSAQGLLCAFDSLYVMVNGKPKDRNGLYRVRDTDGDDQYDDVQLLRLFRGHGEHGPHAIVLAPDGKSLFICAGNHTDLPEPTAARVPRNWQEDQLLPRMWDANGHAVGRLAPGGWICRTDPDGKSLELMSCGYRNEFDIAFNSAGELFTFDADMEWDIGLPWYRPTRICHATSGSEFGWRAGTGKWPPYYPDSLPAVVNIGPGSPTGITFGTGAKFPAKYQRALFASDWSYGVLYAVHLEPAGSTYTGTFERFATASPLPLTDLVINPGDGAMYFTIGGRRTQSGLYRVTYVGNESVSPLAPIADTGTDARRLRAKLEALHGSPSPTAVDEAWPYLSHSDRFVRYAARVTIEHQPVDSWQDRALAEQDPVASILALIALSRCGEPEVQPALLQALDRIDWDLLAKDQRLALLRAYGLACARLGKPSKELRKQILDKLDAHYPAGDRVYNRELVRVLVYLEAPHVVERTLQLISAAPTQQERVHYLLSLRTLESGWTQPQRREYFDWLNKSVQLAGGHSFRGFIDNIRKESAEHLTDEQRESLADVLEVQIDASQSDTPPPRPFVRKWQLSEFSPTTLDLNSRDLSTGREMFAAALCFNCHRFAGEGGNIGPDLTGVGNRFDNKYLLESLIEPSKAVSDQYQSTVFQLESGKTVIGKVANLQENDLWVITNMLEPGEFTIVDVREIDEQHPSEVSMMPTGLLDTLTRDEVLDLLAYLKSGGASISAAAER